jgi:hypothetical protein
VILSQIVNPQQKNQIPLTTDDFMVHMKPRISIEDFYFMPGNYHTPLRQLWQIASLRFHSHQQNAMLLGTVT